MRSLMLQLLLWAGVVSAVGACGVKGDPLPPTEPPTLGRGYPTYSNTLQRLNQPEEASENQQEGTTLNSGEEE